MDHGSAHRVYRGLSPVAHAEEERLGDDIPKLFFNQSITSAKWGEKVKDIFNLCTADGR